MLRPANFSDVNLLWFDPFKILFIIILKKALIYVAYSTFMFIIIFVIYWRFSLVMPFMLCKSVCFGYVFKESLAVAYNFIHRYEGALDPWMSALWKMLYKKNPKLLPSGPDFLTSDATLIDLPKIQILYHDVDEVKPQLSTSTGNLVFLYFLVNLKVNIHPRIIFLLAIRIIL